MFAFDPDLAAVPGFPVAVLSVGLTMLLVAVAANGLLAVGVILMVALLIAPAVAAR